METDVLIVGGGIAGLSLAWKLAPTRRVVLVEAEPRLAHHTSSRSARQMQPSYGPSVIKELTLRSIAMVEKISASLPAPILKPRAMITLGSKEEVAALVLQHPDLVALDHAETLQRSPDLAPDGFGAGALDDSAMEVDVPALLEFYRGQAQAAGAVVLTDAPVTAAHTTSAHTVSAEPTPGVHSSRAFTVTAGAHRITANIVVNAAGAWVDQVAAVFGVQAKGLVPHRRSVAIVSTASPVNPAGPMVEPADESFYFRPDGGHLLISPCESVPAEPGDAQVVDADITELIHRIDAVTTLEITGVVRSWTGLRTEAADGVPVVGFDADVPNFFWLAGQGGYGIQTSAALATFAAVLIAGTVPAEDVAWAAELSPQRTGL